MAFGVGYQVPGRQNARQAAGDSHTESRQRKEETPAERPTAEVQQVRYSQLPSSAGAASQEPANLLNDLNLSQLAEEQFGV